MALRKERAGVIAGAYLLDTKETGDRTPELLKRFRKEKSS
jgi:hypothetical protein